MSRFLVVILFSLVATLQVQAFVTFHHALINPVYPLDYAYMHPEYYVTPLQTRFDRWDLLDLFIAFLRPSSSSSTTTTTNTTSDQPESP